jgi:hypothetical protein
MSNLGEVADQPGPAPQRQLGNLKPYGRPGPGPVKDAAPGRTPEAAAAALPRVRVRVCEPDSGPGPGSGPTVTQAMKSVRSPPRPAGPGFAMQWHSGWQTHRGTGILRSGPLAGRGPPISVLRRSGAGGDVAAAEPGPVAPGGEWATSESGPSRRRRYRGA